MYLWSRIDHLSSKIYADMEDYLKFSIIIIGYNQQAVICRAIKSAFEQSYKNLEVIYVDDASTDNSVEIIKHSFPDSRLRIIENHRNQGSSVARLLGIKAATGEWCLFVDGDDFLCTDACEILHKTISEQDEETDIIGFGANIICSESVSKVSENWIKDKACEPVLGSHSTRELLRIQYGTREKACWCGTSVSELMYYAPRKHLRNMKCSID